MNNPVVQAPPSYDASVATPTQPVLSGPPSTTVDENATRTFLNSKEWPAGLQNYLIKSINKTPYRFFICDDSGSMATNDGERLVGPKLVKCTRWTELVESLRFHSTLAHVLGAPTQFRFLNSASPIVIGDRSCPNNYSIFQGLLDGSPGGLTPLCRHIQEVTQQIAQMQHTLRSAGQKALIIIATDGEASDGDLPRVMAPLKDLPVNVVVRLCTNDEVVGAYWDNVDKQLEFSIDVLDDQGGEAGEIFGPNPWLTYGEPLHRLREFGVPLKEFDTIDEAKLSPDQLRSMCSIIFDIPVNDIPHPEAEHKQFVAVISRANGQLKSVWSPKAKVLRPWIELSHLKRQYGPQGCCSMM